MAGEAQFRLASRHVWGLTIYRGLVSFAFLVVGFRAFPDHKAVFALGVIAFDTGVAAIGETVRIGRLADNYVMNESERKTRHTITLAQARAMAGETCNDYTFWSEVNERVADELGPEDEKFSAWKSAGLVASNVLGRLVSDFVVVFLALLFSGA